MIDITFNKLRCGPRLVTSFAILALTTACAHNDQDVTAPIPPSNAAVKTTLPTFPDASSISVKQIGTRSQVLSAPQIKRGASDKAQLSIEQLRSFADRCLPDSQFPPPTGLDCSEINLRMQRLLRADDTVLNALITLGQLGRNDSLARTLNDLNGGRSGKSLTGVAIAGGLINGGSPPPSPPLESTPELEEFLQENGLIINQGIILRLPQ